MFYQYDSANTFHVPKPFQRDLTPIFQAGDPAIPNAAFSVSMAEWDEGGSADPHIHEKHMEAMYCIAGKGSAQIGEKIYDLKPDAMVVAPIGVQHQLKNTGKDKLRVICIYSPAITTNEFLDRAIKAVKAMSEK